MSQTASIHLYLTLFVTIFFHSSEYILAIAIHGRRNVTVESLLIYNGYFLDTSISFLEYLIQAHFFPGLKEHRWITYSGLLLVVIGEIVRKTAILTAGIAFTHRIRTRIDDERHRLVTRGIYSFARHPSYTGYLIRTIGTQIMLSNPVSTFWLGSIVWWSFKKRVSHEEHFLNKMFGSQYVEYAKLVPSGLPFVK